ncbi:MAG TPA: hypothetical protein VD930_13115 [Gemmatimonadales bacterium]|nr:hypothetical protein [Gemmatimonadales bacterium]
MAPTSEIQSTARSVPSRSDSCAQTRPPFALVTLRLSPGWCAALLSFVVGGIVGISLIASFLSFMPVADPLLDHIRQTLVRLSWVDGEANIPSWFSGSLLLTAALLLGTVAAVEQRMGGNRVDHWFVLCLIFLFLSLDEIAQLHELSIVPIRQWIGASGFLYYAWILPAGVLVGVFVLSYLRFLARLPERTRGLLLVAGAVYVGGSLGVESISGWQAAKHGEHDPVYHAIITLEETCEMTGIVLFIYALLDYLGARSSRIALHITQSKRADRE